jgi:predicted site-specific integrase-resolvase
MPQYVSPKKAMQVLGVSERTLRYWEADGKISAIRTPSGHRRYDVESYLRAKGKDNRAIILYSRVSSYKQREDLERQSSFLATQFPEGETVKEIGGGLNFKRKGLITILGRVMSGDVKQIVVSHPDRLARFGVELIRWICEQNACELLVLSRTDLSPEREMVEDILAIVHVFSCRLYGLRKYKSQIKEDSDLPK